MILSVTGSDKMPAGNCRVSTKYLIFFFFPTVRFKKEFFNVSVNKMKVSLPVSLGPNS